MSSTAIAAHEYWGYLIKADKSPTPVFEQLLLGVANYINHHIAPWDTQCLTPAKLAAFYRLVGGDYDLLFLDTSQTSLSFIYQSLGCYHTLQPERDPYTAPTIPALTPQGFVRWQTVQLLLEPEEHVPFLQEAVKRFDLLNPADGIPFPSILPKEALPTLPDPDISEWHDSVSQKLMLEAQTSAARDLPPRPQMALSDVESSRDSSVDSRSVTSTDMAGYFAVPRVSHRFPPSTNIRASTQVQTPQHPNEAPWSPERRRSSLSESGRGHPTPWPREGNAPTSFPSPLRNVRPQHHARNDSDLSTISTSTSDSSSMTTGSPSLSPVRYHSQRQPPLSPDERQHATNPPFQRPASHPQGYIAHQLQPSEPLATAKNVRWQDMEDVHDGPRYNADPPRGDERPRRSSNPYNGSERPDDRGRGRASRNSGPNTGVGGRRYADGGGWR